MRRSVLGNFLPGRPATAVLLAVIILLIAPATKAQQVAPVPVTPVTSATLESQIDPESAQETRIVNLAINKTLLIELPEPVQDVIIANPAIVDIVVKTPTKLYLMAREMGGTNVFFLGQDDKILAHMIVQVDIDLAAAQAAIKSLIPNTKIELSAANGAVVLSGTVRTAKESADAAAIAVRFASTDAPVINMLQVLEDMQVMLQVRISEIQRNVVKNLGINSAISRTFGGRQVNVTTGGATNIGSQITTGRIVIDAFGLSSVTFNALETQGLVKTLAEPSLIAISGETANFLAGGEFPTPSGVDTNGNVVFELREFGVSLNFTPTVLSNDQISLKIFTEITQLTNQNSITLANGIVVRGLTKRAAESTVTLPSGGNIMIAGLLQNDEANTINGAPWLKDIPVIGALFRSNAFTSNRTELVVLLTAYLVRPVESGRGLAMPTDGFVPSSDFDFHVMGRLHKQYSKRKGAVEIPAIRGPFGYIME